MGLVFFIIKCNFLTLDSWYAPVLCSFDPLLYSFGAAQSRAVSEPEPGRLAEALAFYSL